MISARNFQRIHTRFPSGALIYLQFPLFERVKEREESKRTADFPSVRRKIDRDPGNSRYYFMLHPLSPVCVLYVKRATRTPRERDGSAFDLRHYFAYGNPLYIYIYISLFMLRRSFTRSRVVFLERRDKNEDDRHGRGSHYRFRRRRRIVVNCEMKLPRDEKPRKQETSSLRKGIISVSLFFSLSLLLALGGSRSPGKLCYSFKFALSDRRHGSAV